MSTGNEILLTQAAIDGELDAAGMLDFENRLAGNASLAAGYGRLKTIKYPFHWSRESNAEICFDGRHGRNSRLR